MREISKLENKAVIIKKGRERSENVGNRLLVFYGDMSCRWSKKYQVLCHDVLERKEMEQRGC